MKNRIIKFNRLILVAMICIIAFSSVNNVWAAKPVTDAHTGTPSSGGGTMTLDEVSPNDTIKDNAKDTTGTAKAAQRILQAVLTITQVIGVGVAVIMLIVLAIKYISAAPSDKAEIKKHMVVYVVGAVVLFAASGILEIIKRFALMVDV